MGIHNHSAVMAHARKAPPGRDSPKQTCRAYLETAGAILCLYWEENHQATDRSTASQGEASGHCEPQQDVEIKTTRPPSAPQGSSLKLSPHLIYIYCADRENIVPNYSYKSSKGSKGKASFQHARRWKSCGKSSFVHIRRLTTPFHNLATLPF